MEKMDTKTLAVETPAAEPSQESSQRLSQTGIAELIWQAKVSPPKPIIADLLHEKEIAGLHGAPEVFKTIFTLQLAESLATGKPFLGAWKVPKPRRVYYLETEMSEAALGNRLAKVYADETPPKGIYFANETQLKEFRKAADLQQKFSLLREWLGEVRPDVLILDTANPFFRGKESPNDETTAGAFFDLLADLPTKTKLFVRHNRKPKMDDSDDAASKIRGSGQFSDVPDLLLELRRPNKQTNGAILGVTKYRHGSKADDLPLWLDAQRLRLVSLPPVIYLLLSGPRSRPELLASLGARFGAKQKKADELIAEQRPYLVERMSGHKRMFDLDLEAASNADSGADWYQRLWQYRKSTPAEDCPRDREEKTQPCVFPTLPIEGENP